MASPVNSGDLVNQGASELRPQDWTVREPLLSSSEESDGSSMGDDNDDAASDAVDKGDKARLLAKARTIKTASRLRPMLLSLARVLEPPVRAVDA